MSEDTMKKEKVQRCVISNLNYDPTTQLISLEADLVGKLQKGTASTGVEWQIEVARTKLTMVKVPLRELIVKVLVGWFWVRIIQDQLRKGSKSEAQAAMAKGYDWSQSLAKEATKAAPSVVAERALGQMTPEQIAEFITKAQAMISKAE